MKCFKTSVDDIKACIVDYDTEFITADSIAPTDFHEILVHKPCSILNSFITETVSVCIVDMLKIIKVCNEYISV